MLSHCLPHQRALSKAILTIRLPDDTRDHLAAMARTRCVNLNKLLEELSTRALAEHDTELRFRLRAARGDPERGLAILKVLDEGA
ncbi:MAG: toxin-antitoxin system HicB family antitoxin [Paracoccaceae bacterium]